jgi:hypothetical protein
MATDQIDWLACMDTCQAGAETGGAAMKPRRRKATKLRPRKGVTAAHLTIENARLSNELRQEELRALCEVSQAVNSTLDIETVLATIVSKAVQLSMLPKRCAALCPHLTKADDDGCTLTNVGNPSPA